MTIHTNETAETPTIRPITADELPAFLKALSVGFGENDVPAEDVAPFQAAFPLDRSLAAFEDGQIVATAGAYAYRLTLPGGARIPVAAVTTVTVRPTHRRRGLLTALMRRQLADVRAWGESVAVLNASESRIYGRFGYGIATQRTNREIETAYAALRERPSGDIRIRLVPHEEAMPILKRVYDQWAPTQPGALSRPAEYWPNYLSRPQGSDNQSPRMYAIAYNAQEEPVGYVHYRLELKWEHNIAQSTLAVGELFALTPEASASLWDYCLRMDLVKMVRTTRRPAEDPLRWMLTDPRRQRVVDLNDDLWVRLVDIPAALQARGYTTRDTLTFDVTDPFWPENAGRYRLETDGSGAHCERIKAPSGQADLALGVAELGAMYLGGMRATTLAAAGRIGGSDEALRRADALFWSPVEPYCGTSF